jgi:XTP/dITP diphosphohydrolase
MLRFVTTNEGKLREAREYLGADSDVAQLDVDTTEVQADDIGTVAAHSAREAHEQVGEPVIVEDSGLFVEALDGFPGPYSAYVEDTLGIERVWRLVEPEADHAAAFRSVIAYCDGAGFEATPEPVDTDRRGPDQAADERGDATTDAQVADGDVPVKLFTGYVPGELVAPRGEGGFGYDPIFEHDGTTFAEMDAAEKNAVSHRGRALARFAEWYGAAER